MLRELAALTAPPEFQVPFRAMHPLEDFKSAVEESVLRPESGKRFFRMQP